MKRIVIAWCALGLLPAPASAAEYSLRDAAGAPIDVEASRRLAQTDEPAAGAPVSVGRAVLYSVLLPGLGDWKLGHRDRAAVFFAVEGVIWASFVAFQVQGGDLEDEYQALAVRFAGVSRTGHSDEFYATIREYDSAEQYEADVKNDGRFGGLFPDIGSDALDRYFVENRVSDYEPWLWASTERRFQYSEVRSASKTAYRRADYMLAAAAANRLASAVFTYAAARGAAKRGVDVGVNVSPYGDVALTVTKSF